MSDLETEHRDQRFDEAGRDGVTTVTADGGRAIVWYGSASGIAARLRAQGFVGLARHVAAQPGRAAYLHDVRVDRGRRGEGIGTALVRESLLVASRRGCPRLYLHVQPEDRRVADLAGFYRRLGFGLVGGVSDGPSPAMVAAVAVPTAQAAKPPPPPQPGLFDRRANPRVWTLRQRVAALGALVRVSLDDMDRTRLLEDDRPDLALAVLDRWSAGEGSVEDLREGMRLARQAHTAYGRVSDATEGDARDVAYVGVATSAALIRAFDLAVRAAEGRTEATINDDLEFWQVVAAWSYNDEPGKATAQRMRTAMELAAEPPEQSRRPNPYGATTDGAVPDPVTGVTPDEMLALWPVVSDWVGGGNFNAGTDFARDLRRHKAALAKLRPTLPLRVWRAATMKADEFRHPSAWTLDRELAVDLTRDGIMHAGVGVRILLETVAQPSDVWCSLEDLQAACRRMGLRIVIDPQEWREVILVTGAYKVTARDRKLFDAAAKVAAKARRTKDYAKRRAMADASIGAMSGAEVRVK